MLAELTESEGRIASDEEMNDKNFTGKMSFFMINDDALEDTGERVETSAIKQELFDSSDQHEDGEVPRLFLQTNQLSRISELAEQENTHRTYGISKPSAVGLVANDEEEYQLVEGALGDTSKSLAIHDEFSF